MKLSRKAEKYYRLVLGQRIGDIESWFQPEMNRVQSSTNAQGGVKNRRIADVLIERWKRIVDARVECLSEAYELYNGVLEEADVEEFFSNLMSGITPVQASFGQHIGTAGADSRYLSHHLEPINRSAGNKLHIALTRMELDRRASTARGDQMYRPRFSTEHSFFEELDGRGVGIKVEPEPGVPGRQYPAKAIRIAPDKLLLSKGRSSIERGHQFQYQEGSEWWEVVDKEEEMSGDDVLIGYLITAESVGQDRKRMKKRDEATVVIHGPVTGGVQVGGSHNVQTVTVNQHFNESFNRLREAIEGSPELTTYQKQDAIEALDKLPALAKEERSEGVIKRAKEKLELVKSIISIGKDLAIVAMPYLEAIAKHWS